jgi:hypothetical protein
MKRHVRSAVVIIALVVLAIALLEGLVGCGGNASRGAPKPKSAAELYAEADRHESEAEAHDSLGREMAGTPARPRCADPVVTDQSTSGTERLTPVPCWSVELSPTERHRLAAERLRAEAAVHRHDARVLLDAERAACAGVSADDMDHTPFWHHDDILAGEATLDGTRVRGARVLFRAVPGLTVVWMERVLVCHQAHAAAIGYAPTHLGYCPASVQGAKIQVSEASGGILVTIRADDEAAALVIYGRAEALLDAAP